MSRSIKLFLVLLAFCNQLVAGTSIYFVHNDHRGAPVMMTDSSAEKVWEANYKPFGEVEVDEDPDGDGKAIELNVRLPGQYYDKETGTYYNYYRDYDPSLGRYIQADPIGIMMDFSDPQMQVAIDHGLPLTQGMDLRGGAHLHDPFSQLNHPYGYVNQNPLMLTDPFGLAPKMTCAQKLKACRARTGRHPILGGANRVKCEELYGALSDCTDDDDKNQCKP